LQLRFAINLAARIRGLFGF